MDPVAIPSSVERAIDHMEQLVDSWCTRHDGNVAILDQAAALARDAWTYLGIDLTDPTIAIATAVALDGFIRATFDGSATAGTVLRARAFCIPLAATIIHTLRGD